MKSYKQFIKESKRDIHSICSEYGINDYTINPDESIDVDGNVILSYDFERGELTKIPLKFAKVSGDFECSGNQLTSLEYCPESVGGNFDCHSNQLTSLEGLPEIGGYINCRRNQITDFKGVSEFFEGLFYCEGNPIEEIYTLFLQENHVDDSKCIKWINEFDVIQGNKVIMDRLDEVFYQLGMDKWVNVLRSKKIRFKNYKII